MKKILLGMAAVCALLLSSCNEKASLAKEVAGTWSGAPVTVSDNAAGDYTVIDTYVFTIDKTGESGNVEIASMINGTLPATHPALSFDQPISAGISGKTTIEGSWRAIDDDEIVVMLDPESMKVEVNPVELVLSENILSKETTDKPQDMSATVAQVVKADFQRVMLPYYTRINHLDDVKVKDNSILKFEIGKTDYSLMRQTK